MKSLEHVSIITPFILLFTNHALLENNIVRLYGALSHKRQVCKKEPFSVQYAPTTNPGRSGYRRSDYGARPVR